MHIYTRETEELSIPFGKKISHLGSWSFYALTTLHVPEKFSHPVFPFPAFPPVAPFPKPYVYLHSKNKRNGWKSTLYPVSSVYSLLLSRCFFQCIRDDWALNYKCVYENAFHAHVHKNKKWGGGGGVKHAVGYVHYTSFQIIGHKLRTISDHDLRTFSFIHSSCRLEKINSIMVVLATEHAICNRTQAE